MIINKHKIETVDQARHYIEERFSFLPIQHKVLVHPILENEKFWTYPASTVKHQIFPGGLAVHTAQVLNTALAILSTVQDADTNAVTVAVLYHDYAKILDYQPVDVPNAEDESKIDLKWILGYGYIVKPDDPIPNYPYDCLEVPEIWLKPVE